MTVTGPPNAMMPPPGAIGFYHAATPQVIFVDQVIGQGLPIEGISGGNPVPVSDGGSQTMALAAATPAVVKAAAGCLCRVLVTTAGTGAGIFYDNASAASGTVIGYVPANAAIGTPYSFQMPAANGIYYGGAANSPALTVSWD